MKTQAVMTKLAKIEKQQLAAAKKYSYEPQKHWMIKDYRKTKNIFRFNRKCFLDMNDLESRSYNWWAVTKRINGKLVFNNYSYSSSTSGHQSTIRSALDYLGIKIDYTLEVPGGLQDGLQSSLDLYVNRIEDLVELINKPRTLKRKNLERIATIKHYRKKIEQIKKLMKGGN